MDIGDIGSLIFFAIIALSFLGRFFGGGEEDNGRPSAPRELRESGGHDPSLPEPIHHQPMVTHTPDEQLVVEVPPARQARRDSQRPPSSRGNARSAAEARRQERMGGRELGPQQIQEAQQRAQERYGTSGVPDVYADRQQPRRSSTASPLKRRRRIMEGGDVLRRSLKDPATLERGFIVKEVLDVPVGLRRDD